MNSGVKTWLLLGLLWLGVPAWGLAEGFDFSPLAAHDRDVNGNERWRFLGPLIEYRQAPEGASFWAFRPLTSRMDMPSNRWTERDVLWPFWTGKRFNNEYHWRFLVVMLWHNFNVQDPDGRYRFWMIPFYFQGRGKDGQNYLAVFPFGGTLRDFLTYDEAGFALFPLAGYARVNDVQTRYYLWPIVSSTHSEAHGIDQFRVFPFYGYSRRRADYDKSFILWPFWTQVRYGIPGSSGDGYVLFPLWGHVKLEDQESWMVVPPFFRFSKGAKLSQVNCPWPLIQQSSGRTDKFYLWPFWGYRAQNHFRYQFVLWPFFSRASRAGVHKDSSKTMLIPFYYSETVEHKGVPVADAAPEEAEASLLNPFPEDAPEQVMPPEEPGSSEVASQDLKALPAVKRSMKVWPLFSWRRADSRSYLAVPSLCPFKDWEVVERNYAALWTLYTRVSSGALVEDEVLWGLYQYRRTESQVLKWSLFPLAAYQAESDSAGWEVLKGLVGYKRAGVKRTFTLLYGFNFNSDATP